MTLAPEPPLPRLSLPDEPCHACHAPLAADQRYCLTCGLRRGSGGPIDFGALAAQLRPRRPAPRARQRLLGYPTPVAATMLAALLIAGVVLGSLGSQPSSAEVAGGLDVVLPQAAPQTAPRSPQPAPQPAPPPAAEPAADQPEAPVQTDDSDTSTGGADSAQDGSSDQGSGKDTSPKDASPIKHVFVIMLAEQAQPDAFGPGSAAPQLSTQLVAKGTLLSGLRTVADAGLPTTIALLSGQGPNAQTQAGCPLYTDVAPGTIGDDNQEQGAGCVYSVQTATLANQLEQQGLRWRAYVEDQAHGGPGVPSGCRHPVTGAADPWRAARPNDAYATARNPFVYFHAITDSDDCAKNVADLGALDADLAAKADDVPSLSYIVPNLCHDAGATPCALGAPAGPASADAFVSAIVAKIQASKAYEDSLVVVTFERPAPPASAPVPASPAAPRDPGGQVGALLLSPFVAEGDKVDGRYDTYSLLAMIEDVFGLDHLGLAGAADVAKISPGVLTSGDAAATTK